MRKKICIAMLVIFSISMVTAGGQNDAERETFVIKTGIGYNDQSLQYKTLAFMKVVLEEINDGAVIMELYNSSTLGDDMAILEVLQLGTVEMFCGTI